MVVDLVVPVLVVRVSVTEGVMVMVTSSLGKSATLGFQTVGFWGLNRFISVPSL